ncbi:MAG: vitamin K epoxide reductase family protein [Candidatus Gracilibacteria bacterium]|nr:vitamin K epoxide reductase family protein [Candidatus Gracilibacteria bacterium]MDQ7022630.1 vitamin K epoxide reductase family protein [Candidatus Gracilibacteria bacterium]
MKILKIIFILLVIIGIGISSYLTYTHFTNVSVACGTENSQVFGITQETSDCNSVLNSKYSEILGVPVSILGILFYIGILVLFLLNLYKEKFNKITKIKYFDKFLLIGTSIGLLMSIYFTFVQLFILKSFCVYCFTSACITLILFGFTIFLYKKGGLK